MSAAGSSCGAQFSVPSSFALNKQSQEACACSRSTLLPTLTQCPTSAFVWSYRRLKLIGARVLVLESCCSGLGLIMGARPFASDHEHVAEAKARNARSSMGTCRPNRNANAAAAQSPAELAEDWRNHFDC